MLGRYLQCLSLVILVLPASLQRAGQGNRCQQPRVSGSPSCGARQKLYYYNSEKGRCVQFSYYGCRGNSNRFRTKKECQHKCECSASLDYGSHCPNGKRGTVIRFYYDPESGLCRNFWYVGCGGNRNNFGSIRHCEQACSRKGGAQPKQWSIKRTNKKSSSAKRSNMKRSNSKSKSKKQSKKKVLSKKDKASLNSVLAMVKKFTASLSRQNARI